MLSIYKLSLYILKIYNSARQNKKRKIREYLQNYFRSKCLNKNTLQITQKIETVFPIVSNVLVRSNSKMTLNS